MPEDIFGQQQFVHMDSMRIGQNIGALQKGRYTLNTAKFASGLGENIAFEEIIKKLFTFIEGVPSDLSTAFGEDTDITQKIISDTIIQGNIANRIIDDLQIPQEKRFGEKMKIEDNILAEVYGKYVDLFQNQLRQIQNKFNN